MIVTEYTIRERLRKHHLYATRSRVDILALIYSLNTIVSTGVIIEASGHAFDRTTVYRTLQLFCRKRLLKPVPNTNGLVEFSLISGQDKKQPAAGKKAEFICETCGLHKTVRLKGALQMEPPLKHLVKQIVVKGLCEHCEKKNLSPNTRN